MKLRVVQRNAAFGLTVQMSIANDRIIAVATATAVLVKALPKVDPLAPTPLTPRNCGVSIRYRV